MIKPYTKDENGHCGIFSVFVFAVIVTLQSQSGQIMQVQAMYCNLQENTSMKEKWAFKWLKAKRNKAQQNTNLQIAFTCSLFAVFHFEYFS